MSEFEIFMSVAPGLEPVLAQEAREKGFAGVTPVAGGVTCRGDRTEVWRANLEMRGAARVLVRIGAFRAFHLAQLDKRARKFGWGDVVPAGGDIRVEVSTRRSKIYHAGAAAQRIERALSEEHGMQIRKEAALVLKVRIDDNLVQMSLDSSGEALHKRGHKPAVGKAPMRENLAALFLRDCGFTGSEPVPVVDPMCGSGTFVIEAAEIAAGFQPGRDREFAFEGFAGFDRETFAAMRRPGCARTPDVTFHGFDRDQGAIQNATRNAAQAGVGDWATFACQPVSALQPPDGPKGLVIANPPYGGRIGNRKMLFALYGSLGQVLRERFKGWRVGVITSDGGLAKAMGLPVQPGPIVDHGGIKVRLYKTGLLG